MKINLPNQITIIRLLLSAILFTCLAMFSVEDRQTWLIDSAGVLFLVAALSDALDGYLARKHNQITSLGRILDPFVDKILVCGTYAFLAGNSFVNENGVNVTDVAVWMVVVILSRELLVSSLRSVTEAGGQSFGANIYGKAKMILQSITAIWILFSVGHPDSFLGSSGFMTARLIVLYLTVAVTVLSMVSYVWSARHVFLQQTAEEA
jgi:CDP-diacylglycerol--glycerol-3-phosphate 3-phosphatidyltransferase